VLRCAPVKRHPKTTDATGGDIAYSAASR